MDLDAILSNSLVQLVDQPTRNEAILDKIVTNLAAHYNPVEICSPIGLSDHRCVVMKPKAPLPRDSTSRQRVARPMRDSDIREFGQWLCDHDWSEVSSAESVTDKCSEFYSTLHQVIEIYFPQRTVKQYSHDKAWITPYIKMLVTRRQRAFHDGKTSLWRYNMCIVFAKSLKSSKLESLVPQRRSTSG